MYGDKGPPKGYSVPRYDSGSAARYCQRCASKMHWSYECPSKNGGGGGGPTSGAAASSPRSSGTARLSRTQMLKYGVKRKRADFVPELTEREAYNQEMKALQRILVAEVREEVKGAATKARKRPDPTEAETAPPACRAKPERVPDHSEPAVKREHSADDEH